jgi:hypothetical protein
MATPRLLAILLVTALLALSFSPGTYAPLYDQCPPVHHTSIL